MAEAYLAAEVKQMVEDYLAQKEKEEQEMAQALKEAFDGRQLEVLMKIWSKLHILDLSNAWTDEEGHEIKKRLGKLEEEFKRNVW